MAVEVHPAKAVRQTPLPKMGGSGSKDTSIKALMDVVKEEYQHQKKINAGHNHVILQYK